MSGIFKAYDIRAKNEELTDDIAYKIGAEFFLLLQRQTKKKQLTIAVGYDMRPSSPRLAQAVIDGFIDRGGNILDVGLCSTPMNYFAVATLSVDGGIMVTSSHNPAGTNGFKFCKEGAVAVTYETGINEIEKGISEHSLDDYEYPKQGTVEERSILSPYINLMCSFCNMEIPLKIVIDTGNGMGGLEVSAFEENFPHIEVVPLYFALDGTFPNHQANPVNFDTLKVLQKKVIEENANFGAAMDGDADRIVFVDETGTIIKPDLINGLLGSHKVEENGRKGKILYDLRSTKAVAEHISAVGGTPVMSRVGHSYIQNMMQAENALFGGELSGHFYFNDFYNCDNALLTLITMINYLSSTGKVLSDCVHPLKSYCNSGEINFSVINKDAVMEGIKQHYIEYLDTEMDGIRIVTDVFWFVLRKSNTEPVIRLVLESVSQEMLQEKVAEVSKFIKKYDYQTL